MINNESYFDDSAETATGGSADTYIRPSQHDLSPEQLEVIDWVTNGDISVEEGMLALERLAKKST